MASRPPNYSQDRANRERAQATKAREKADRKAEQTARRKAMLDDAGLPEDPAA